jgi:ComF family protein
MFSIKPLYKCYVCGELNCEIGNICSICKSKSLLIRGTICCTCGIPLVSEIDQCLRCRQNEYSFDGNVALFEYKNTAKEIFYQYKFKKHRKIALWYAAMMREIIDRDYYDYLIVPSPYRVYKKIVKGWDQVECISEILRKQYKLPVVSLLKRSGSLDQKKLDLQGRKANLKGKITLKPHKEGLKGKKLLFIDDIFTTGATSSECASVLKKQGVQIVRVLTVAID